jgi:hypothetical protein
LAQPNQIVVSAATRHRRPQSRPHPPRRPRSGVYPLRPSGGRGRGPSRSDGRVRWALPALCNPHLTPALSAPEGQRGRYGRAGNEPSEACPLWPLGASFGESSALGERGDVARAVQHADDDQRVRKGPIVARTG